MFIYNNTIEHFEVDKQPLIYKDNMFRNCNKLDTTNLFREGLAGIESGAFHGCNQIESVKLPKSLKSLSDIAFKLCENLNSIEFTGMTVIVEDSLNKLVIRDDIDYDYEKIKFTCPYDYPFKNFENNLEVVRKEPTEEDKKNDIKIAKATMLGMNLADYDVAITKDQVVNAMKLMNPDKFREQLIECIKTAGLISGNQQDFPYIIGENGVFIYADIARPILAKSRGEKATRFIETPRYIALVTGNSIYAYIVDLETIMDRIKFNYGIKKYSKDYVQVPYLYDRISYGVIDRVYEKNGNLVIVDDLGYERCYGNGSFK